MGLDIKQVLIARTTNIESSCLGLETGGLNSGEVLILSILISGAILILSILNSGAVLILSILNSGAVLIMTSLNDGVVYIAEHYCTFLFVFKSYHMYI